MLAKQLQKATVSFNMSTHLSIHLHIYPSSLATTARIFTKFYVGILIQTCQSKSGLIWTKIADMIHEDSWIFKEF